MTADSSKKEEKEMTTPASLASIAAQTKQPGTKSLGIGLEARGVHAWSKIVSMLMVARYLAGNNNASA